jgi:hypothetical protein
MANAQKWTYKLLQLTQSSSKQTEAKPTTLQIFLNQLLDSAIVGGIAGLSAYLAAGDEATFKVLGLAFTLTFLFKLKDYRKIA